ncbi:MAG: glycosyltransferase [Pelomonas sp.]|nr:glycosyltransferase [Roseateles sp.]
MNQPRLHIISQLRSPFGGTEQRSMQLHRLLGEVADVTLWNTHPRPELARQFYPAARRLHARYLSFPLSGVFFFIGNFDWHVGRWLSFTRPTRMVVLLNTPDMHLSRPFLQRLHGFKPGVPIDLCYAADWMREVVGLPGVVHASPIDLERFRAAPARDPQRPFTVGRLSRDVAAKHHPEDPALYRRLAAQGVQVRLMGATVLAKALEGVAGVEILPEGAEPADAFLRSLDCFYYRTHPDWVEPSGRVICEAMATSLPVVCVPPGGFTEVIDAGVNGFVTADTDATYAALLELAAAPQRCAEVGAQARAAMERRYGAAALREQMAFIAAPAAADDVRALLNQPA